MLEIFPGKNPVTADGIPFAYKVETLNFNFALIMKLVAACALHRITRQNLQVCPSLPTVAMQRKYVASACKPVSPLCSFNPAVEKKKDRML